MLGIAPAPSHQLLDPFLGVLPAHLSLAHEVAHHLFGALARELGEGHAGSERALQRVSR